MSSRPPKVYIAARYERRLEMLEHQKDIESRGIRVISRWIKHGPECDKIGPAYSALADRADLVKADVLLFFSEEGPFPRGGRHVEFGMALGMLRPIFVVGPKENVFHHIPGVRHFNTYEEARDAIVAHFTRVVEDTVG